MVRVTCLSPTKKVLLLFFSFCSLEKLDLQASNDDPSTWSNQRATYKANKVDLRTIHQNKIKAPKECTK